MKKPDKIGKHTPYPGARQYVIHFYEGEDAAYIFAPDFPDEPMMKFGPINNKTALEVNVIARKAARYLLGLEFDRMKLEDEGYTFLAAPHWPDKPQRQIKKGAVYREEADKLPKTKPKWL